MKVNKIVKTAMVCFLSLFTVFSLTTVNVDNNNIFTEINAQETGHITINANTDVNGDFQSLANKKFNVYKIFDAENSAGMESINYTINPVYEKALKKATGKSTEYEIIDYIQTLNNNLVIGDVSHTQENESTYSNLRYFIENLRNEIVTEKVEPTMTVTVPEDVTDSYTLDVPFGWYIIDEVTQVEGTHSAASLCMVNTANPNVEIDIKSDYPMIIKQIREDNNRSNIGQNNDGWNDVADFEIGQTVPFRVGTFVPNINGYKTYYFAIHDRMDEALTFNEDSVVVKLGNFTLEKDVDYTVVTEGIGDETFQIQFKDLKATVNKYYYSAEPVSESEETEKEYGQFIEVNYNATLNDKAQLNTGRDGFENDVKLEFSNNPDSDGTGQTGETPWDTVVCFTFRMDGIKVNDQSERSLQGAKFKLYADEECTKEIRVKTGIEEGSYVVISRDEDEDEGEPMPHTENEGVEIISNENGIFNIIGLDSQTYYLKETKAPSGYRLLKDPIKITVKATYGNRNNYIKGDGATDKTLKKLEATASFKEFYSGEYSEYDNNLTTDVESGTLNIKVVNKVGSKLPATGSVATVLLVGAGSTVMASVIIRNRRKKEAE